MKFELPLDPPECKEPPFYKEDLEVEFSCGTFATVEHNGEWIECIEVQVPWALSLENIKDIDDEFEKFTSYEYRAQRAGEDYEDWLIDQAESKMDEPDYHRLF